MTRTLAWTETFEPSLTCIDELQAQGPNGIPGSVRLVEPEAYGGIGNIRGDSSRPPDVAVGTRAEMVKFLRLVGFSQSAANRYPHQFSGDGRQRNCEVTVGAGRVKDRKMARSL
jgi:ABC-type dipeptide/oligopeptide/nickel transport system ATPase component